MNVYHESSQKLRVKISDYALQRKHEFLYPFLFSCWLKANMIAGAGAAILGQETKVTVEDDRVERACVPSTTQPPYAGRLNCSVRENKLLYRLSFCVLVFLLL